MKKIYSIMVMLAGLTVWCAAAVDVNILNNGVIYTDENASRIYLNDGQTRVLVQGPGCGQYYSVSPDERYIGYKYMERPGGLQTPAIYDRQLEKSIFLSDPVQQAGQVSFSNDGHTAYTLGKELHVVKDGKTTVYDLGNYANLAPVSPDGRYVVFNDEDDRLSLMDLNKRKITEISTPGCVEPGWSPDGRYIHYYVLDGSARIYDTITGKNTDLGAAASITWSGDADQIAYIRCDYSPELVLQNRVLETRRLSDGSIQVLAQGKDLHSPHILKNGNCVWMDADKMINGSSRSAVTLTEDPEYYAQPAIQKNVLDVPYIHQVYDTPGTYGYSSCGPTTAAMVMAYYEILPKWRYKSGSGNWNDYGAYVHNKYYYDGYYFDLQYSGSSYSCYGGMGYMWNGGSPNSKMASYFNKHGVSTNQTWNTSWSTVTAGIDAGQPYSLCVMLTSSGHLIAATGRVEGQRVIIANDPYGNKNTSGYPSYDGKNSYYDWPGYNNGYVDLDAGYPGSYGSALPWAIRTTYTIPEPSDSLVDDKDVATGFHLNAYYTTVPMRYFHSSKTGHNAHHWWTYTETGHADVCQVTWTPSLDRSGCYDIKAFIPAAATSVCAPYKITHPGGETLVTVNQNDADDEWVSLGKYLVDKDAVCSVQLGDSSSTSGEIIAYDAVKWETSETDPVDFVSNVQMTSTYNHVQFTGTSYLAEGDYIYTWNFGDGQSAQGLNVQHAYDFPGNYTVSLTVTAADLSMTVTRENYMMVTSSLPPDFTLLGPVASEIVQTQTPALVWEASDNAASYLVYCEKSLNIGLDIPAACDTARYIPADSLEENATYYWHVKALLASGDTLNSDFQSFRVNAYNEAPGEFLPESPADSVILRETSPRISWFEAVDPDPDDSVTYELYFNETMVYSGAEIFYDLPEDALEENGSYVWYVKAVDTHDSTRVTGERTLFLNQTNEAPFASTLLYPGEDDVLTTLYPELLWTQAADPDPGDAVSYKVYFWFVGSSYKNTITTSDTSYDRKQFWDNKSYYMTVASIDQDGLKTYSDTVTFHIDVSSALEDVPREFSLGTNYPNPFNPATVIPFALPQASHVTLTVYDLEGRKIRTLADGDYSAGYYSAVLQGADLSSGVYIYSLVTDSYRESRKMLLVK